jgi:hypothetical protein
MGGPFYFASHARRPLAHLASGAMTDYDVFADGIVVGRIFKATPDRWRTVDGGRSSSSITKIAHQRTATPRRARRRPADGGTTGRYTVETPRHKRGKAGV